MSMKTFTDLMQLGDVRLITSRGGVEALIQNYPRYSQTNCLGSREFCSAIYIVHGINDLLP